MLRHLATSRTISQLPAECQQSCIMDIRSKWHFIFQRSLIEILLFASVILLDILLLDVPSTQKHIHSIMCVFRISGDLGWSIFWESTFLMAAFGNFLTWPSVHCLDLMSRCVPSGGRDAFTLTLCLPLSHLLHFYCLYFFNFMSL